MILFSHSHSFVDYCVSNVVVAAHFTGAAASCEANNRNLFPINDNKDFGPSCSHDHESVEFESEEDLISEEGITEEDL